MRLPSLTEWRRHRRAARELHAMSDRDLADLGVFRCDIERVVRGAPSR